MKKAYLVLAITLVAVGAIYLWLHSIRRPYQVIISDDKLIVGDGAGPYVNRAQGTVVDDKPHDRNGLCLFLGNSQRSLSTRFGDAQWKDRAFFDIPPVIPSGNYRISIFIGVGDIGLDWSRVMSLKIGEQIGPSICLSINPPIGGLIRSPIEPQPPQELYKHGHAYLVREGEDKWALDVDAWFKTYGGFGGRTYYVRLTFRLTIEYGPWL